MPDFPIFSRPEASRTASAGTSPVVENAHGGVPGAAGAAAPFGMSRGALAGLPRVSNSSTDVLSAAPGGFSAPAIQRSDSLSDCAAKIRDGATDVASPALAKVLPSAYDDLAALELQRTTRSSFGSRGGASAGRTIDALRDEAMEEHTFNLIDRFVHCHGRQPSDCELVWLNAQAVYERIRKGDEAYCSEHCGVLQMYLSERYGIPRNTLRRLTLSCGGGGRNYSHAILLHDPRGFPWEEGVDLAKLVRHLKQDISGCTILDPWGDRKVVAFGSGSDIEDFAVACEEAMRDALPSGVSRNRLTKLMMCDLAANPETHANYLSDALFNAKWS